MGTVKKSAASISKKGNETTTPAMASLAGKTLNNPNATALEKKFAAALINQAPDKPKPVAKKPSK